MVKRHLFYPRRWLLHLVVVTFSPANSVCNYTELQAVSNGLTNFEVLIS